jgi:1-acyl-sn-glycerol-3-phosphate acyltransferase
MAALPVYLVRLLLRIVRTLLLATQVLSVGPAGTLVTAAAYVAIRPFSEPLWLRAACRIQQSFLVAFVWQVEHLIGVKVRVTGEMPRAEPALVLPNHQGHDWAPMYSVAYRIGTIGLVRTVIKKAVKHVPGIGWFLSMTYWPFVSRDFARDEVALKRLFGKYEAARLPVQVWLYAEGTRMSAAKLAAAQEAERQHGYRVWREVLLPRHRGFLLALRSLRDTVTMIHEVTIRYEGWGADGAAAPSLAQLIFSDTRDHAHTIHVHCRRTPIADVDGDDEPAAKQWLLDCFQRKEDDLAGFRATGRFPGPAVNGDVALLPLAANMTAWGIATVAMFAGARRLLTTR